MPGSGTQQRHLYMAVALRYLLLVDTSVSVSTRARPRRCSWRCLRRTKAATAQPAAEIETDGTARLLQTRHTDGLYVTTQLRFGLGSGPTARDRLLVKTTGNIIVGARPIGAPNGREWGNRAFPPAAIINVAVRQRQRSPATAFVVASAVP